MKSYNIEYLNTHYAFVEAFLFKADKNVLDISYSVVEKVIAIQVVILEGFSLPIQLVENIKKSLPDFVVAITELHLTKEQFNENKGEWLPRYYKWMDYLLFSKAEIL